MCLSGPSEKFEENPYYGVRYLEVNMNDNICVPTAICE